MLLDLMNDQIHQVFYFLKMFSFLNTYGGPNSHSFIHSLLFIHYQVPVMFQALFQGCKYSSEIDKIPALVRLTFLSMYSLQTTGDEDTADE